MLHITRCEVPVDGCRSWLEICKSMSLRDVSHPPLRAERCDALTFPLPFPAVSFPNPPSPPSPSWLSRPIVIRGRFIIHIPRDVRLPGGLAITRRAPTGEHTKRARAQASHRITSKRLTESIDIFAELGKPWVCLRVTSESRQRIEPHKMEFLTASPSNARRGAFRAPRVASDVRLWVSWTVLTSGSVKKGCAGNTLRTGQARVSKAQNIVRGDSHRVVSVESSRTPSRPLLSNTATGCCLPSGGC